LKLANYKGVHYRNRIVTLCHSRKAIDTTLANWLHDLSRLDADLRRVLSLGLAEVNLFPEPVGTEALIDLIAAAGLLPEGVAAADVGHSGAYAEYDICTKHGPALGGPPGGRYCTSAADVRAQFARFLAEWAMMRRTTVSCIAWDEASNEAAVDLLKLQGVRAIEVAPTRFWEWDTMEAAAAAGDLGGLAAGLAADLERWGLQASSLQAMACTRSPTSCSSAAPRRARMVVDLGAALWGAGAESPGVVPIVFGAPKNRVRPEGMTEGEADNIFVQVFKPLAEYAHACGCSICVEPNAP
jgi:hypothetical protein